MTARPEHLPERLALLADMQAATYITEGLLTGREDVPSIALNKATEELPVDDARFRLRPVRDLIDDVMHKFRDDERPPTAADAWLAPRLHATLRLTRREAADARLWSYLALGVAPDYVVRRHLPATPRKDGGARSVARARFRGPHYTQAFARLWWAAELFRNGPDYSPVVIACGNQDMLNTALRMDVVDHRPTALALVRLIEREVIRTGREANALASAVNASAATLMYDVVAQDSERDAEPLRDWIAAAEGASPVGRNTLPEGPQEERAPENSVVVLTDYFEGLYADAPVRGRELVEESSAG
ncbi:DUF6339 family protein [Streptomyces tauricus]|uniref:DUF6339 family protein n=1 Tax=Streptomyces tauricus TaxID=68274 RepID=UPI0033B40EEE